MGESMSKTLTSKKDKIAGAWLGVLLFMRTMPCYLWAYEDFLRPLCAILIMAFCVANISKEKWTKLIFSLIASAYIWATVFVDHSSVVTLFNFLAFAFIPTLKKEVVYETYRVFRKILVVIISLSIVNYILILLGIDFMGVVIDPINKLKDYKYIMHPFVVTPLGLESTRFHAIYDEPGSVGTLVGLILIAEKMNLQKKGNLVLLIAGLLSLSFYFYIAMIYGFILFSKRLKRKWLYMSVLIGFIIVSYNNEFLYNTLWYRFEYDVDRGTLVGDNRSSRSLDNAYDAIKNTPLFFTGIGSAAAEDFAGSASFKLIILKHGFIFLALNMLGYFLLAIRQISDRRDLLFFFIFFILTLYQRPGFYNTSSIFMYVIVINIFGSYNYGNRLNIKSLRRV